MKKIILRLFDPQNAKPIFFLIVIYLLGITTNNLSDALKPFAEPWQIGLAGTLLLILIMLLLDPIPKFVNYLIRGHGSLVSEMGNPPQRHKGLIVSCSMGENISAEQAIRYHYRGLNNEHRDVGLQKCWLITGGKASVEAAERLKERLIKDGVPNELFVDVPMTGDNADNPAQVYKIIEKIYNDLPTGFEESDIIADYTGGTKSMTAGMILACSLPQRKLQVLKPRKYKDDGTAERSAGSDPRFIDIRFKLKQIGK